MIMVDGIGVGRNFVGMAGGENTMSEVRSGASIIIPWSAELDLRLLSVGDGLCSLRMP